MKLLEKLVNLEQDAENYGFSWENTSQIMAQIKSECIEVEEHLIETSIENNSDLQEEIGDLLHAVFSLCVYCKFSPEETLRNSLFKFESRLKAVKKLANDDGLNNLTGHSFEKLMSYWDRAKDISENK